MSSWRSHLSRRGAQAGKFAGILTQRSYRTALYRGVAAAVEHERIPFDEEFSAILDVGAHRGQFALVARRRFPNARLLCFEPLPGPRARFEQVMAGDSLVTLEPVAVGAVDGTSVMHISGQDDSSSLLPITPRQVASFPGTAEIRAIEVPVRRLDTVVTKNELIHPTLLKVDVQGFELEVLKGAVEILDAVHTALIECSFVELYSAQPLAHDVITWMGDHCFVLAGVYSPAYDESHVCLQADLLFKRSAC